MLKWIITRAGWRMSAATKATGIATAFTYGCGATNGGCEEGHRLMGHRSSVIGEEVDPKGGDSPASAKIADSAKNPSNFVAPASITWPVKGAGNPLDLPPLHVIPPLPPALPPLVSNVDS